MPWALFSIFARHFCVDQVLAAIRDLNKSSKAPRATCFYLVLTGKHIHLVVMRCMQGRGRRGRNPCTVCTRLRVADLSLQHIAPSDQASPTCLCRSARAPADHRPDRYRRCDPHRTAIQAAASSRLWRPSARFHRRVDFVAGAVQKPGVDKGHARFGRPNTFLQVARGAALFVHDPQLYGIGRQAQTASTRVKISSAKATSSGPCILGFTTYTRAFDGVAAVDVARSCMAIIVVIIASISPSPTSLPSRSSDRRVCHQSARHCGSTSARGLLASSLAIGAVKAAILFQFAGHRLAALF